MRRARREAVRNACKPILAGAAAGLIVMACGTASSSHAAGPKSLPYNLYTHCGVNEARVGDRYYRATPPLSDGSGNPPAGWGNPYQAGTMTLASATKAVFTDTSGHRVVFSLRPGATAFLATCS